MNQIDKAEEIRINLENAIKALKITNQCLNRVLDRMEKKPEVKAKPRVVR